MEVTEGDIIDDYTLGYYVKVLRSQVRRYYTETSLTEAGVPGELIRKALLETRYQPRIRLGIQETI